MRLIEVTFPSADADRVREAMEAEDPEFWRIEPAAADDKCAARAFYANGDAQKLVDRLQDIFEGDGDWRLLVYPVEATAPKPDVVDEVGRGEDNGERALREEIYDDVADGAALSSNFIVLTLASTVVAAIGLNSDNVAAVIGAMVIAPLLGPVLAVSLGTTLGDFSLILRSGRNALIGLGLGMFAAVPIGLLTEVDLQSAELMSRTVVGLDAMALALAAGVAAALSIVTGVSAALVGVMVAAALLPPAAAAGLFAGAGEMTFAARSLLLLVVNVICVLISSQAVYAWKGVRPRTWLEKRSAKRAIAINIGVLLVLLAAAALIIVLAPTEIMPDTPLTGEARPGE